MISRRFIMSITQVFTPYYRPQIAIIPASSRHHTSQIANANVIQHRMLTSWPENPSSGYRCVTDVHRRMQYRNVHTRTFKAYNSVLPGGAPLPSQPRPNNYLSWILGIVVTLVLPFVTNRWGPLLKIKNEVDTSVETVEEIVEVVEQAAEVVDKVAENISHKLPEGGKLKEMVEFVENVAEETAKDAHIVETAIDKFQETEEKVENVIEAISPEAKYLLKEPKDVTS